MYTPLSSLYLPTLMGGSPHIVVRADVYRGGALLASSLPIVGGEVKLNVDDPIRRTCEVTFADASATDLIPAGPGDAMYPNGTQVQLWHGLRYSDGSEELVPVGRYRITRSRVGHFGTLTCEGSDNIYTLSTPLSTVYPINPGSELGDAVINLLAKKNPTLNYVRTVTGVPVVFQLVDLDDVPITVARKLLFASGYDIYADAVGNIVIGDLALNTAAIPVLSFSDRAIDSTQLRAKFWTPERDIDATNVPSVVVVVGNSSGQTTPVRVVVRDTDPDSPTYADGPYGEVTVNVTSDKVGTQSQASRLGLATLRDRTFVEKHTFKCPPVGALEGGDTITVTHAKLNVMNDAALVTDYTLPLEAGDMDVTAVTRRTQATTIVQD